MKQSILAMGLIAMMSASVSAADYVIDNTGAHASINFKIKHLGYSWLTGRFNTFDGKFSYDPAKPSDAKIWVNIETDSVDSNHAERDKHLRSEDFLHASKYPKAQFVSNKVEVLGVDKLKIHGDFTLHGITKPIIITASKIGEGKDPWGGYRVGFEGTTQIAMADYGITKNLGPASTHVELSLNIEGIQQ